MYNKYIWDSQELFQSQRFSTLGLSLPGSTDGFREVSSSELRIRGSSRAGESQKSWQG